MLLFEKNLKDGFNFFMVTDSTLPIKVFKMCFLEAVHVKVFI